MIPNVRRLLLLLCAMLWLAPVRAEPVPQAGLIATDRVASAASERERVKALVARPEVARKLETLGVLPGDAQARIDALTDAEVAALAARIDALPAGGLSDTQWLLVIVIILLLVILL
jgi:hypothetical protein